MQHTINCVSRRSVANEAEAPDLLHGDSQKALMWERSFVFETRLDPEQLLDSVCHDV